MSIKYYFIAVFLLGTSLAQAMDVTQPQGQSTLTEAQKALFMFRARGLMFVKAAQENKTAVVNALLPTIGTLINTKDQAGKSALHHAVGNQNREMVQALVRAQADITLADNAGQTPLDLARETNNTEIIALLSPKQK